MNSWWKNAVGYQVYPRSFNDSNGDGIGDIQGIIEKLDYIKELGVDFIWLNPIYTSPNYDNGYDISDYEDIQPEFGTMNDFKELLTKAHEKGMKLILDLVVNHTSDEHPWFKEAKKSRDNPYHEYYLWHDVMENQLPNDWQSFFGGSVWTYNKQMEQAYFHVFSPHQPDLNWKNPKLRQEIYNMIRFWLEMGIDGFRLDAISHIQKAPWDFKITDNPWEPFMNVDGIDTYMKELRTIFAEYGATTVGEASGVSSRDACFWTGENGYVDMIFELEHNVRRGKIGKETIDILGMKKVLARWQNDLQEQGWNALYMENHDNPRTVSLLGDDSAKSAKAIATMYLLLKGTPFVYQGQEIGMTNFPFSSMEQIDAEDTCNLYNAKLQAGYPEEVAFEQAVNWTRDHSRTPMQWDNQSNGGFTTGKPWMLVNPNTTEVNVAVERSCKDSVLAYYKQLIYLRKKDPVFLTGAFELLLENHPQVFAYLRKTAQQQRLVLVNLGATPCQIDLPKSIYTKTWQACLSNTHSIELKERLYIGPYDAWVFKSE